jgi:dihydrofolate reductase
MSSKVYCDTTISLDGFSAGVNQRQDKPFGDDPAGDLHRWMFEAADANAAERGAITNAGAFIMGRNMFSAGRGEWDETWRGWWGDDPPYHAPVFVLTHHPRKSLQMEGGTTYTFVTDGIESALAQARQAAGDRDVAIAGGAATVSQYLRAGAIDELRVHIAPIWLGAGESPFAGVDPFSLEPIAARASELVTHLTYRAAK